MSFNLVGVCVSVCVCKSCTEPDSAESTKITKVSGPNLQKITIFYDTWI